MAPRTNCWSACVAWSVEALLLALLLTWPLRVVADGRKVTVTGSVQSDMLVPQDDAAIGASADGDKFLSNTYADVALSSRWVDAGLRFEYLEHPLPGYEADFKGWGVPNFWAKGKYKNLELTLGTTYDQFGSGFVYRAYEQRSLGVDNSLLGARLVWRTQGFSFKALTGRQRNYWHWNKSWITGADAEVNIDRWVKSLRDRDIHLMLGGSWVNKHEGQEDIMVDATHKLNLPTEVNSWDARTQLQKGGFVLLVEYAHKSQDPSFDNGYVYGPGHVEMVSASYSKRGFSLLAQVKRSQNMSWRSLRSATGTGSMINHLPAFATEHTYALPALYPYATHPSGEWAYHAEAAYTLPKGTLLGGRYGTKLKVNFSHIHSLDEDPADVVMGTDGPQPAFWKWGKDTYYQDLNFTIDKKLSKTVKVTAMYMNQFYNKTAIEGEGGMLHNDIFVADVRWNVARRVTLRCEAQYLSSRDDQGDWWYWLAEVSLAPHWMFTVADLYNSGSTDIHYYQGLVTFNIKSHRLQLGYGRTRAGYNCAGGVCRYVPATRGVTLSYNYNF